jgi:hypothetical protein
MDIVPNVMKKKRKTYRECDGNLRPVLHENAMPQMN